METVILLHRIKYSYRTDEYNGPMVESDVEHIEKCIKDGISQGELCTTMPDNAGTTYYGWWEIIK